jgi:hypothetical protein
MAGVRRASGLWLQVALLWISAAGPGLCAADATQTPAVLESEIKAAMIYNFAKFVEWPPEALGGEGDPVVVGVLGNYPFGATLETVLRGKTVQGRPVLLRRFDMAPHLGACHILFISKTERNRLPEMLPALRQASVLTVSDMDNFARLGGVIGLVLEDSKIRFQVNADAARQAGLKVSSKLLKLATPMPGSREGGGI